MNLTPVNSSWQFMEFASTLEDARQAEGEILQQSAQRGFGEADLFDIKLALHEALVNAVKHGNKLAPDKQVRVRYRYNANRLEISIQDEGNGFDPTSLADPTADENLDRPSGRGVLLMRACMDSVVFNPAGNTVTMSKVKSAP